MMSKAINNIGLSFRKEKIADIFPSLVRLFSVKLLSFIRAWWKLEASKTFLLYIMADKV